jgi:hypothetical protein
VLSGNGHERILDDGWGEFVSNQWDGWTDGNGRGMQCLY